jgi:hypothetical protein
MAAIFKAMHDDIRQVRVEMAAFRSDTTGARNDVQVLTGRVRQLEGRLLIALGAIAGVLAGLLIVALR